MAKKNFYAVFGTSGLGVVCNWAACQKAMKYLEKPGCKGTRTLNEAKYIAIKEYCSCSGDDFQGPIPVGFILRRKEIQKIKEMELDPECELMLNFEGKKPIFNVCK